MEPANQSSRFWGKFIWCFVLAAVLAVVLYAAFAIYQFFNPPVQSQDELQVGTQLVWENNVEITDRDTCFPATTPLTLLVKYGELAGDRPTQTVTLTITHKATSEVMLQEKWQDEADSPGREFPLNNETWEPGTYLIQFTRDGQTSDEMELVLE